VTVPAVCSITDPFIYEDKDTRFVTGRELGFMLMILFSAMATSMAMPYVTDTVNRWHPNNAGLKVKNSVCRHGWAIAVFPVLTVHSYLD
jgi:hypothetical protein